MNFRVNKKNTKKLWILVDSLDFSGDVDNIYVVKAKNEKDAYFKIERKGFSRIVKEIKNDSLPLKVFIR